MKDVLKEVGASMHFILFLYISKLKEYSLGAFICLLFTNHNRSKKNIPRKILNYDQLIVHMNLRRHG